MADKLIRIGRVSSIDYDAGMISVAYPDLDDATSDYLSVVSCNDEYKMPKIGDEVLTVHLPSGQARGVVIGKYWNLTNLPAETGADVYRKELGHTQGQAYLSYKDEGTLKIHAPEIVLETPDGSISLTELLAALS